MGTIQQQIPSLNARLIGKLSDDSELALFRGIPYASVNKRWTHSTITHTLESPFDATNFGPRCVQNTGHVLVTGGTTDPTPGDDEFKCLNLNICVPKDSLPGPDGNSSNGSLLPVLVWIHGGAFAYGANSVSRYRPHVISKLAKESGHPYVLVQIQYRLGHFGFAVSKDLASEDPEFLGNYGFLDQRNALEWVQAHIAGFGGDPSNVTVFGVSAGSYSCAYHILGGDPLFDRAFLMSGSGMALGASSLEDFDKPWQNVCKAFNFQDEEPAVRVQKMRDLSVADVLKTYKGSASPYGDGKILPTKWNREMVHPSTRCKSIVMGDTNNEALIMDKLIENIPPKAFQERVYSSFPEELASDILSSFGFRKDETDFEKYRSAMHHFLSVAFFQFPNVLLAESFSKVGKAYYYHFEVPSPYEGPTFGCSYHGFCALTLHLTEIDIYPEAHQNVAKDMARALAAFTWGKEPWEEYKEKRFMRFGPSQTGMMVEKDDETRDYKYSQLMRDKFEDIQKFAHGLMHEQTASVALFEKDTWDSKKA
ncbi:hypothetical protein N7454_001660 [Penicillium verhagenii]|nr:hypothetical protein N7454_001660 [Penicillium verhagenii]